VQAQVAAAEAEIAALEAQLQLEAEATGVGQGAAAADTAQVTEAPAIAPAIAPAAPAAAAKTAKPTRSANPSRMKRPVHFVMPDADLRKDTAKQPRVLLGADASRVRRAASARTPLSPLPAQGQTQPLGGNAQNEENGGAKKRRKKLFKAGGAEVFDEDLENGGGEAAPASSFSAKMDFSFKVNHSHQVREQAVFHTFSLVPVSVHAAALFRRFTGRTRSPKPARRLSRRS